MKKTLLLTAALLLLTLAAAAQKANTELVFSTAKGAIKGYDPVAYFTDGLPVAGLDSITYVWNGATWHFASVEHRDLFAQYPEKFAPQYGGYCAYGWAQGYAVKIEPEAWKIVDGKLYLNYDRSVQKKWEKDTATYIRKADENWAKQ
jgi:YHS domain-containing protein